MQKLEAVGRLAGGVAHDFNNILGVILGRSSMVQSRLQRRDPLWADMEAIRSACMQGASLTRHMMALSRREPAIARPLDLNELVRTFSRGLLSLIGADVEMVLDLHEEPACVLADHAQLEQVLLNLVVNARDAMPGGGTLTIRTTLERERCAVLTVTDTGMGMDPDTQSKIFDPFFSTKPHGTGLGLSTVYGIVQQIQGSISVSSSPGSGSTFTVRMPRCELPPAKPSVEVLREVGVARGQARILVVEDQRSLRETIQEALIEAEYQVAAVGDPLMAIALVERGDLEVEVLVTDLVMPKLGGRELAARIRAKRPAVRILYMSGYDRQRHAEETNAIASAPAARLLTKPFAIEELTRAIAEVLSEEPST
jgi:CheY-like chemotaxis protein